MKKPSSIVTIIQFLLMFLVSGVILALILFFFTPIHKWYYVVRGFTSAPDPPYPEITYGEFPFELIYKINGQEITVEDTVICQFDGMAAGSNGKWRKWGASLANEEALSEDSDVSLRIATNGTDEIYFLLGDARYYMGEPGAEKSIYQALFLKRQGGSKSWIPKGELLDSYGIEIISWTPSPPIKNSFQ